MWSFLSPYNDEWRGNKIAKFEIHKVKGQTDGPARIVDLCTSADIVAQVKMISEERAEDLDVPSELADEYSHRLYFPNGPGLDLRPVLSLLGKVLSIRIPNVDVAIAFDWYAFPPDAEHAEWRTTPLAEVRKKAKFWVNSPQVMGEARTTLTGYMTRFLQLHPLYGSADTIIATPGHDRSRLSCGEDLAKRLATSTGMPLMMTDTAYEQREQAKGDRPVDLSGQFSMPDDLSDLSVIVVDDCIKSGRTLKHMGFAAREAGAARVLGLAPVRTMRGS